MRILSLLAGSALAGSLACAGGGAGQAPAPRTPTPADTPVVLLRLDPGPATLGRNLLRATVRNTSGRPVPFQLSVRSESPALAIQRSDYRLLQPGETAEIAHAYELPDPGYRLLLVYHGVATGMPTGEDPYPRFASRAVERFAVDPGRGRSRPAPETTPGEAPALAPERAAARRRLAQLLGWDRPAAPSFAPRAGAPLMIGEYRQQAVEIATEPGRTIGLLFVRRAGAAGRLPTVLFLSGNPPGTKESGLVPGLILADQGFQVVAIDRRESARETTRGGYLSAIADPVFDARRAIDYLLTRDDVDGSRIAALGYSRGAAEALLLLALHESVRAGVFASGLVAQDSLFTSSAWLPTVYSPDVLDDVGLGQLNDRDRLEAAITPDITARAHRAYRARYPYFGALDPAALFPLAAPRPVLLVAAGRDPQLALPGVFALDDSVQAVYRAAGVPDRAELLVFPRSDHFLPGAYLEQAGRWLSEWLRPRAP